MGKNKNKPGKGRWKRGRPASPSSSPAPISLDTAVEPGTAASSARARAPVDIDIYAGQLPEIVMKPSRTGAEWELKMKEVPNLVLWTLLETGDVGEQPVFCFVKNKPLFKHVVVCAVTGFNASDVRRYRDQLLFGLGEEPALLSVRTPGSNTTIFDPIRALLEQPMGKKWKMRMKRKEKKERKKERERSASASASVSAKKAKTVAAADAGAEDEDEAEDEAEAEMDVEDTGASASAHTGSSGRSRIGPSVPVEFEVETLPLHPLSLVLSSREQLENGYPVPEAWVCGVDSASASASSAASVSASVELCECPPGEFKPRVNHPYQKDNVHVRTQGSAMSMGVAPIVTELGLAHVVAQLAAEAEAEAEAEAGGGSEDEVEVEVEAAGDGEGDEKGKGKGKAGGRSSGRVSYKIEDNFVSTQPHSSPSQSRSQAQAQSPALYGLDCEMVITQAGFELARVTVVDSALKIVLDRFVQPENPVIDYVTTFSGVTAECLHGIEWSWRDAREAVMNIMSCDDVLVGHSLENDLLALKLSHRRVLDTALLYPHPRPGLKYSLKRLAQKYLGRTIQEAAGGHDSVEDARIALELAQLKLKKGSAFGVQLTEGGGGVNMPIVKLLSDDGVRTRLIGKERVLNSHIAGSCDAIVCGDDAECVKKLLKMGDPPYGFSFVCLDDVGQFWRDRERAYALEKACGREGNGSDGDSDSDDDFDAKGGVPGSQEDAATHSGKVVGVGRNLARIADSLPHGTLVMVVFVNPCRYPYSKMEQRRRFGKAAGTWTSGDESSFKMLVQHLRSSALLLHVVSKIV